MSVDHYENFPVASVLCPPALRPAIVAIYRFARAADDLADEGPATRGEREAALRAYRAALRAVFTGQAHEGPWAGIFDALGRAVHDFGLPERPLSDLLQAFEQDVRNPHYATRDELLAYCRLSANPVGRLLMHLYRIDDPQALRQSDAICTALQLINFWQDLSVDLPRGRCYLPTSESAALPTDPATGAPAPVDSPALRQLVASLCDWAETLMLEGAPLVFRLRGRAGWELRLVVQGGLRVLEKIRHLSHGTASVRPRLHAPDLVRMAWRAWRMRDHEAARA